MSDAAGPDFRHQRWASSLGRVSFLLIILLTENSVRLDERFLLQSFVNCSVWLVRYVGALCIDGLFYSLPFHSVAQVRAKAYSVGCHLRFSDKIQ